jgi:hypothetical protein
MFCADMLGQFADFADTAVRLLPPLWTTQRLARAFCPKHPPLLQRARIMFAVGFVAHYRLDREHFARPFPPSPTYVAAGAAGAARSVWRRISIHCRQTSCH